MGFQILEKKNVIKSVNLQTKNKHSCNSAPHTIIIIIIIHHIALSDDISKNVRMSLKVKQGFQMRLFYKYKCIFRLSSFILINAKPRICFLKNTNYTKCLCLPYPSWNAFFPFFFFFFLGKVWTMHGTSGLLHLSQQNLEYV